jgi:hypothetical protein
MVLAGVLALSLTACRSGGGAQPGASAWVEHRDPRGFRVQHPGNWKIETGEGGMVIVRDPSGGGMVLVQPFFMKERARAMDWLGGTPQRLARPFPASRVLRTAQIRRRPDEAAASLAYRDAAGTGRANLLCSIFGRSGMLYAVAAPESRFAALKPALVRILLSFRYTEASNPAVGGAVSPGYVTFQDPKEGAFTVDVPRGWTATGGLYRFAPVDTRASLRVESPDGKIRIGAGDHELPTFTVPNPMLTATGFTEGRWYSPGYGVNMLVRSYMKGSEFAAAYVQRNFSSTCGTMQITERRDRPDLDARLGSIYSQFGQMQVKLTTGEVAFTCGQGARLRRGYYFAGTEMTSGYGTGLWNVKYLHGYLADDDAVELAGAVLARMVASSRVNPQWAAMQSNIAGQTSEIVTRTNAEISRMLQESYWHRQRVQDNVSRQWSNTILGLTDVADPQTGETWKASSGHNYYWRKQATDAVVGTNTYERPDTDFSPLKEW